ncbi:MAG TPA: metallophosphoesterase family protein [Gaiellaceae bacterium]|nr:metallophosphoesterase family protein [Gaiellaceae bacterium]
MRVALFSDVHGNAVAFRTFLADLDGQDVDRVVCLGDHAQGGAQPAECLELLRERGWSAVMGNSDHFLLTLDPGEEAVTDAQLDMARWSASQLSDELLEFHRSFRPTVEVDLGEGRTLLAFHGSPRSRDEILGPWLEEQAWREPFDDADATILAGGHTHLQWTRRLGDRYYVNPGSVGLAYDHNQPEETFRTDPFAEYAIVTLDGSAVDVQFRRIAFDGAEVLRAIEESGMPHAERAARFWRQRGIPT